jgi:hypothetical protein
LLEAGVIDLGGIVPLPGNPKTHDTAGIGLSFGEFGFIERVIVNRTTGHLLGGHGRIEALREAKARGEEPPAGVQAKGAEWFVPCDFCRIPAEREMAACIALNRWTERGGTDTDLLLAALEGIAIQDEALLAAAGYNAGDLEALAEEEERPGLEPPEERDAPAQRRGVPVKAVLHVQDVATVEEALAKTGEKNRGLALVAVCRAYLG